MKVKIEIDTITFVRFWLVVISFGLAGLLIWNARTALVIIGAAAFLALALNGPVSWLANKLPNRSRTLSTAIAFIVIVAILAAILFLAVPPIVQQTISFLQTLPDTIRTMSAQWKGFGAIVSRYHLESQIDQMVVSIQGNATSWLANFGQNFLSGVGTTMSLITEASLALVLTFLMLVEGPRWSRYFWGLYSNDKRMQHHRVIFRRMNAVISGYVSGQLIVSGLDGAFAGLTVFILSQVFPAVPANIALPTIAIMFILSLIPMFGAGIGGIIVFALLAINSMPAAIAFGIYFIIYQQIENNVISPTIQSKRIELSPLMVLMAVTIGLYMFGMVGGIISIPIAGCAKVLATEYIKVERREEPAAKPTKLAHLLKRVRREKSKPEAAKSETEA